MNPATNRTYMCVITLNTTAPRSQRCRHVSRYRLYIFIHLLALPMTRISTFAERHIIAHIIYLSIKILFIRRWACFQPYMQSFTLHILCKDIQVSLFDLITCAFNTTTSSRTATIRVEGAEWDAWVPAVAMGSLATIWRWQSDNRICKIKVYIWLTTLSSFTIFSWPIKPPPPPNALSILC